MYLFFLLQIAPSYEKHKIERRACVTILLVSSILSIYLYDIFKKSWVLSKQLNLSYRLHLITGRYFILDNWKLNLDCHLSVSELPAANHALLFKRKKKTGPIPLPIRLLPPNLVGNKPVPSPANRSRRKPRPPFRRWGEENVTSGGNWRVCSSAN